MKTSLKDDVSIIQSFLISFKLIYEDFAILKVDIQYFQKWYAAIDKK